MSKDKQGRTFDWQIFMRIMRYVLPYRLPFTLTASLTVFLAFYATIRPYLIQYAVDNSITTPNSELLNQMILLIIGFLVVEAGLEFVQTYWANWLGQTVIKDLRKRVYEKIISFRLKYFDNTPIGTLTTRAINDIETIASIFSEGILVIIGDVLKLLVVVCWMYYTNALLASMVLISIPILLIGTRIFQKVIKTAFQDVRAQVAKLNAFVQEHLTGMNIVQIFNREEKEYEQFQEINKAHRNAHLKSVMAYSVFFPVVEILSATSLAMLIWFGSIKVIEDQVTLGELTAFIFYIYMMFRPIRQLADRFNTLQMGIVAAERVFALLDTDAHIDKSEATEKPVVSGDISFKNVWFAYIDEDWVLKDFSLEIKKGENVAIVGPTGAGKTSIINLLSRFYEFNKGQVFVDNQDLKSIDLDHLRRNIGVVLQDVFLFNDTVANNISLNDPNISRAEIESAAKEVGAYDFIMSLPDGFDYVVRERGSMLSVGQRQLLSFIRAYVYNPSILVLDEATSSIDSESEKMIQYATAKLTADRTSIIIAHRLATIQKADRIVVLDKGKIIESGSHQELLAQNGFYKNLFEIQFQEIK